MCQDQGSTCGSPFSPSIMSVPGTKLKLFSLVTSTSTHWAMSLALPRKVLNKYMTSRIPFLCSSKSLKCSFSMMFPKLPYRKQTCKSSLPRSWVWEWWWWCDTESTWFQSPSPLPSPVLRCGLSQNVFAQDRRSHFKGRESRRGGGGGAARQRGHKPHSPMGPERGVSSRPFASIIEHFLSTHPVQPVFKDNFVCSDGNWVSLEQVEKLSKLRLSVYVFLHRRCRTHPRGSGLASASNKTKDFFGFVFNQWYLWNRIPGL